MVLNKHEKLIMADIDVNIVSLNVRGLHNKAKRHTIYNWARTNAFNVCFLQETFAMNSNYKEFNRGWQGEIFHSFSDSTHSRGVCIMLRNNFSYNFRLD